MKALAFVALTAIASAALADGRPMPDPQIRINGDSIQAAVLVHSAVNNSAWGDTDAVQNLASNAGNVTINGDSTQVVVGLHSSVNNTAVGYNAYASQNLSSNLGDVEVGRYGDSLQITALVHSSVNNKAFGKDAKAVQNIASNNACVTCQPTKAYGHGR